MHMHWFRIIYRFHHDILFYFILFLWGNPSLQQWFEYCSNAKKKSCPVCKQTCSEVNVSRLYFQSVGDQSLSQKFVNCKEDPEELQREIERLEGKVSGLSSDLELYKKDVKELSEKVIWFPYRLIRVKNYDGKWGKMKGKERKRKENIFSHMHLVKMKII